VKGVRKFIRNFFGFSRAQTNGFVGLLILLALVLFSEPVTRWWISQRPRDFSYEKAILDSLVLRQQLSVADENRLPSVNEVRVRFFSFNPNTVTDEELSALGFSKRLAQGLLNYRAKGGVFRVKSDVQKLYGMDSTFYHLLHPHILLPEKSEIFKSETSTTKEKLTFDLNEADTTQLKGIYGIGSVLAKRIVTYREKLGGYLQTAQLYEIYKLDSAVIDRLIKASFIEEQFTPRKLNINSVDVKTLQAHPYVSEKVAKAIVGYRFQHGNFQTVDDLRKVHLLDDMVFTKIYPYLSIE
jgi:competence protein ComEA